MTLNFIPSVSHHVAVPNVTARPRFVAGWPLCLKSLVFASYFEWVTLASEIVLSVCRCCPCFALQQILALWAWNFSVHVLFYSRHLHFERETLLSMFCFTADTCTLSVKLCCPCFALHQTLALWAWNFAVHVLLYIRHLHFEHETLLSMFCFTLLIIDVTCHQTSVCVSRVIWGT